MLNGKILGVTGLTGSISKEIASGTSDYEKLKNIPQINNVELIGNKTSEELGLANKSDIPSVPTKVSGFENDAGYLTEMPDEYVKNTDYATNSTAGVVVVSSKLGLNVSQTNGLLSVVEATETQITEGTNKYNPITPNNLDYAVKVGVTTNTLELTEEEKTAAQTWLGIENSGSGDVDLSAYTLKEDFDKLVNNETQIQSDAKNNLLIGGSTVSGNGYSTAIGKKANGSYCGVAIGYQTKAGNNATAVGMNSNAIEQSVAVGRDTIAYKNSVAMGYNSKANSTKSIQLGEGTNNTDNSVQFFDDNIYNHNTHTLTVQNIELNGEDVNTKIAALSGQNEYIGSYDGSDYTVETIQTVLSDFVQTTEGRLARNGDIVNIVNGIYGGQQWINSDGTWKYYIDFENHSVIDNLTSDSAIDGLSAKQGKILKEEIDAIKTQIPKFTATQLEDGSYSLTIGG